MKILRVVSAGYEQGGVENGIVLTNDILRQRGHEVKVLSAVTPADRPHFNDYSFRQIPSTGFKKFIYNAFNIDAYRVMKRVLEEYKPDVVMLHTMGQTTAAILFLLRKYPTLLFVHGPEVFTKSLLPWHMALSDFKHGEYRVADLTLAGRLHYFYFRFLCRPLYLIGFHNVDRIIALSGYTASFLRQENLRAAFIPNGAKLLAPQPFESDQTLLYAGRLEKFKGVDDLIRAMLSVKAEIPQAHLLIAGEGSYGNRLRALVSDLHLQSSVTFLGHQTQTELAQSYKRCTIFILPSAWPETFGKVGIEAMSVGRPVIATDVGGVKDWLIDGANGYLVQQNDPKSLADRIIKLLTDKQTLNQMAYHARESSLKFSIDAMTTNIERIAAEVITEYSQLHVRALGKSPTSRVGFRRLLHGNRTKVPAESRQ